MNYSIADYNLYVNNGHYPINNRITNSYVAFTSQPDTVSLSPPPQKKIK